MENASAIPPPDFGSDAGDAAADAAAGIRVIGVGDPGGNILAALDPALLARVSPAFVNTDVRSLESAPLPSVVARVAIGASVSRGTSAGGEQHIGARAALADEGRLAALVKGARMVFILTGLGGGTGGGAAPEIARLASRAGAFVVSFASAPFEWEGERRARQASAALVKMRLFSELTIPVPNDLLLQSGTASAHGAFALANSWICGAVSALCALLLRRGVPNIDIATLRAIFPARDTKSLFALGRGADAEAALADLWRSPLLKGAEIHRVSRIVIGVRGRPDLHLDTIHAIVREITETLGGRDNVLFSLLADAADAAGGVEICVVGSQGGMVSAEDEAAAGTAGSVVSPASCGAVPAAVSGAPATVAAGAAVFSPAGARQGELDLRVIDRSPLFGDEDAIVDGVNINIPTWQRQGVKIKISL